MELSQTNFDIDLDEYDTEIPWLNRIPSALYLSCVPSPNAISNSVQAALLQNSSTNKASVDLCERSDVMPDVNYPNIRWNDTFAKPKSKPKTKSVQAVKCKVEQSSFNDSSHPLHELCNKPFVCERCQKSFTKKCFLINHKRTHDTIKFNGFTKSNNIIPVQDILPPPSTLESQHGYCRRPFCETGQNRYICTICGKHFSRMRMINDHQKIHTGIGLHCCQFCPRSFTRYRCWKV